MKLKISEFNEIRIIFEQILKKKGYADFSEICGDHTEDFCKELLNMLDEFYDNV